MTLPTKDIEATALHEGDTAIIDGRPTTIEEIHCNSMGCWLHYNNLTASRHYKYNELIAKVIVDSIRS